MTLVQNRFGLLIAVNVLLIGIVGCPQQQTTPESVMEDTWQLIQGQGLNPPLTNWQLTFNSKGEPTQVKCTFANGDKLSMSISQDGSSIEFDGTLDSATETTSAAQ